jgi:Caspase domain
MSVGGYGVARKALILALDDYEGSLRLDAPRNDADLLAETFTALGSAVSTIVSSRDGALTTARIRMHVRRFVEAASSDDELLVYVSGHGIDLNNERLVLPVDYDAEDSSAALHLLSDYDFYVLARSSKAASVLVMLDTCRQPLNLKLITRKGLDTEAGVKGYGGNEPEETVADAPTVALVYSSHPGTFSYATSGAQGVSFFARAVSDVLTHNDQVATLGALLVAVERRLSELLPAEYRQQPYLDERRINGRSGPPSSLVIKEDRAARLRQQMSRSRWCRMLEAAPYWVAISDAPAGLQLQLKALAFRAEELVRNAAKKLPDDRWRDDASVSRFLKMADEIVPGGALAASERALVMATPFVYEAVLASVILRLGEASESVLDPPHEPSVAGAAALASRAWRNVLDREEDWRRRREHFSARSKESSQTELLIWQLWQFAHRAGTVWTYSEQPPGATGLINDFLKEFFAPAPFSEVLTEPRVVQLLSARRLVRFARLLFTDPEDIESEATRTPGGLEQNVTIGGSSDLWHLDEVVVAHVVSLAGGLALDARRLPDVVAEHLGVDEGFDIRAIQSQLEAAQWQKVGSQLNLSLEARYPAIHAALGKVAQELEQHRSRLDQSHAVRSSVRESIPSTILRGNLRPALADDDQPLFDPRHLRFALDQQRVFGLLMGEALYSDPKRALRELYQNALDACRYRRAREALLCRQHQRESSYAGSITISVGMDGGRPFVSCEDNGIGMSERHLRELFARAGRRFTDSHEFHLDQAQFQENQISFWPNSRFGIGVLSYFMLAEEIVVGTRRIEAHGGPAPEGLNVRITGAGSLFRIARNPGLRAAGGTLVKLYLKDLDINLRELLESVLEWLWIPEIQTTLHGANFGLQTLAAGQPTASVTSTLGVLLPVAGTANVLGHIRVYVTPEALAIGRSGNFTAEHVLLDGIVTAVNRGFSSVLVNITDEFAAADVVAVNRARMTVPSTVRAWTERALMSKGGEALLAWGSARSIELAEFVAVQRPMVLALDAELRHGTLRLEGRHVDFVGESRTPEPGLGLSLVDSMIHDLIRHLRFNGRGPEQLLAIRLIELQQAGVPLPRTFEHFARFAEVDRVRTLSMAAQMLLIGEHSWDAAMREWMAAGRIFIRASHAVSARELLAREIFYDLAPSETLEYARQFAELRLLEVSALDILEQWLLISPEIRASLLQANSVRPDCNVGRLSSILELSRSLGFVTAADLLAPLGNTGILEIEPERLRRLDPLSQEELAWLIDAIRSDQSRGGARIASIASHLSSENAITPQQIQNISRAVYQLGLTQRDSDLLELIRRNETTFALLSSNLDARAPYEAVVTRGHLLAALVRLRASDSEIFDAARFLSRIGLLEVDLDSLEQQFRQESRELLGKLSTVWSEGVGLHPKDIRPVGVAQLVEFAMQYGIGAAEVAELVRPLESLGLLDVEIDAFSALPWLSRDIMIILSENLNGHSPFLSAMNSAQLHRAAVVLGVSNAEIASVNAPLLELGLVSGELSTFNADTEPPSPVLRRLLSQNFDGEPPWRTTFSAFSLAAAAQCLQATVVELAIYLNDLRECGIDVDQARKFAAFCERSDAEAP